MEYTITQILGNAAAHVHYHPCSEYQAVFLPSALLEKKRPGDEANIPLTTLGDHVKRGVTRIGAGAPTVLTKEEEREVVATTQVLQQMGFGLTKELVGIVIKDYLDKSTL